MVRSLSRDSEMDVGPIFHDFFGGRKVVELIDKTAGTGSFFTLINALQRERWNKMNYKVVV